ncbi:MAG: Bacterial regulatory protein gntR family [Acidobacteriota bacterium]|jgi:DNA-binding transcriptional regulator YhcF (GntR family)
MNIELKDLSHNPVYAQVREQIENQIKNNTLAAGEQLPSPAALGQKLSVDKGEIQRAYYELEQLGLITKQTGKDFLGKPRADYRVAAANRR